MTTDERAAARRLIALQLAPAGEGDDGLVTDLMRAEAVADKLPVALDALDAQDAEIRKLRIMLSATRHAIRDVLPDLPPERAAILDRALAYDGEEDPSGG